MLENDGKDCSGFWDSMPPVIETSEPVGVIVSVTIVWVELTSAGTIVWARDA